MKNLLYTILVVVGLSAASSAYALTVSPVTLEISGDPGQTVVGNIELLNEEKEEKIFYSSFENFEPTGETGVPHFIGSKDGLATWMKVNSQVDLMPGERRKLSFTVDVPANAEPGGYFSAIFWGTQVPKLEGSDQVSVGGKLGILVLLKVSGEIKEGGGLLEFKEINKQKFFSSLPMSFIYRFNNTGGDRVVPLGDIKIKNLFGSTVITLSANKNEGSILPGSIRKFEIPWNYAESKVDNPNEDKNFSFFETSGRQWNEFHLGWYSAELNITYGTENKIAEANYGFFIFPWQLLLVIFIVLAFVLFFGRMGLKKYNSWVVAQAKKQKN